MVSIKLPGERTNETPTTIATLEFRKEVVLLTGARLFTTTGPCAVMS